jgi:uridine phosphorylase
MCQAKDLNLSLDLSMHKPNARYILHSNDTQLTEKFKAYVGDDNVICGLNVTADSFYSSQGRIDPNFNDENSSLITDILAAQPTAITLEMESFMLLHLAHCATVTAPAMEIDAAAATMIFAGRKSGDFITPEVIERMEGLGGKACLDALIL